MWQELQFLLHEIGHQKSLIKPKHDAYRAESQSLQLGGGDLLPGQGASKQELPRRDTTAVPLQLPGSTQLMLLNSNHALKMQLTQIHVGKYVPQRCRA